MSPSFQKLILSEQVRLYNNLARSGDCEGRLTADFQIYPTPRINWEFESLGPLGCRPRVIEQSQIESGFVGVNFAISRAYGQSFSEGSPGGHGSLIKGISYEASYGETHSLFDFFSFYLPNARFQQVNLVGQREITKNVSYEGRVGEDNIVTEGFFIDVDLHDNLKVHIETHHEALEWLDRTKNNIGTFLTAQGYLYSADTVQAKPTMSLETASSLLKKLSILLSFANGGQLEPLYIEGVKFENGVSRSAAIASAGNTTPLELLGWSWLAIDSAIADYVNCFGVFDRLMQIPVWKESFPVILEWYFQALQFQNVHWLKPWPIIANSIGTALERLCYVILVRELNIRGLDNSNRRIKALLNQIGITKERGYDDFDLVDAFVNLRNEATHPKPAVSTTGDDDKLSVLYKAIQWVEETILWRLGYQGKYTDRSNMRFYSTQMRYDLGSRPRG